MNRTSNTDKIKDIFICSIYEYAKYRHCLDSALRRTGNIPAISFVLFYPPPLPQIHYVTMQY